VSKRGRKFGCCGREINNDSCGGDTGREDTGREDTGRREGGRSNMNGRRRNSFPTNIENLLALLAEDDDNNRVTLILDACCEECVLENVRVIAVLDHTVVVRCHEQFEFICIGCICAVKVDCDDILDELLEANSRFRED